MVKGAINSFTTHEDLERFKKFFETKGELLSPLWGFELTGRYQKVQIGSASVV